MKHLLSRPLYGLKKWLIRAGHRVARPDIFFYCGLWMMVLLIAGTLSQKYIGLYQARLKFFSSFVFWFYGLPLPGARTAMGLILISLIMKTLFSFHKSPKAIGSFIMHGGVILLLTGAFITGVFSQEGYMTIEEGQSTSVVSDYHEIELVIKQEGKTLSLCHEKYLATATNQVLDSSCLKKLPFSLRIREFMKNAVPLGMLKPSRESTEESTEESTGSGKGPKKKTIVPFSGTKPKPSTPKEALSLPRVTKLKREKREKVNEENQAGLVFQTVSVKGEVKDHVLFEPIPLFVSIENKNYMFFLRPVQTIIPFSLKLMDFKKEYYPAGDKVKSYSSLVHIVEGEVEQRRLIKMNRPLRHKSYTFYQSSYIVEGEKETSVLAVVLNSGRAFPYISSLIICLGLLIYMFAVFRPSTASLKKGKRK